MNEKIIDEKINEIVKKFINAKYNVILAQLGSYDALKMTICDKDVAIFNILDNDDRIFDILENILNNNEILSKSLTIRCIRTSVNRFVSIRMNTSYINKVQLEDERELNYIRSKLDFLSLLEDLFDILSNSQ